MCKFSKFVVLTFLAFTMVGCASVGSVANKMVKNNEEGLIYGFGSANKALSVVEICNAISNKDVRCASPSDYVAVAVISKVGYADGAVGIYALVDKDFPNLDTLKHTMLTGNKNSPYVKASVAAGKLGEVVEIMPAGACRWVGMPRIGGTVCEDLFDFRTDYIGVVYK